jgi:hypothetical protein
MAAIYPAVGDATHPAAMPDLPRARAKMIG